ncbi:MAG TPA: glutaredoxin family protein [Verrucomicrobiae bacterium]|nr:glutaredoxin family protein [Verrucomicrobiae bacterium]
MPLLVTIYTKPGCPLCEEALAEVEAARPRQNFQMEEINILTDLALYERYHHAIPVVCVNGVEVFRYRLTSEDLLKKLAEIGRQS